MRASRAQWFADTAVWALDGRGELGVIHQGKASLLRAKRVIIASGAQERPVPFSGWTLPGVMNAGAGQILMKQAGLVPADGVVLAGTGPLLLLLAWQYLRAGVTVQALLDVQPLSNWLRAVPFLPKALLARHYLTKGLRYKRDLKAAGVSVLHGVQQLRAVGGDRVHAVEYLHRGRLQRVETALLLTHFGVIPQTHLSRAAGCRHHWDTPQQCWRPATDPWGATDQPAISVAGDGAGIGGARTAEHAGRLAALDALCRLGRIDAGQRDRLGRQDLTWMRQELWIRPFLDALFRPPTVMLRHPADEEVLCRCEEVTAGEVRRAVGEGHRSPNAVKFLTRCGMGPCQGRQCAESVAQLIASETRSAPSDVEPYRVRTPLKPITIGELAGLEGP
jgi:NADPH-dependent 2,4-dienoyl-CoA reductase/sulfur reductase-like enzyme